MDVSLGVIFGVQIFRSSTGVLSPTMILRELTETCDLTLHGLQWWAWQLGARCLTATKQPPHDTNMWCSSHFSHHLDCHIRIEFISFVFYMFVLAVFTQKSCVLSHVSGVPSLQRKWSQVGHHRLRWCGIWTQRILLGMSHGRLWNLSEWRAAWIF